MIGCVVLVWREERKEIGERIMTALEVCLIAIGLITIVISYFISDKTAEERMKKAVDELVLGEETKRTLIKQARDTVGETLNSMSEEISGKAEVQLEKLSNEKIMMVHEYADTVLEEIGKNHHEVMFLYSMLNDKDNDVKKTVREAQKLVKTMREWSNQAQKYADQANSLAEQESKVERSFDGEQEQVSESRFEQSQKTVSRFEQRPERTRERVSRRRQERSQERYPDEAFERNSERGYKKRSRKKAVEKKEETIELVQNTEEEGYLVPMGEGRDIFLKNEDKRRDAIIALYRQGLSNLEIAKEMGLAVGEVKLVVDLYCASE